MKDVTLRSGTKFTIRFGGSGLRAGSGSRPGTMWMLFWLMTLPRLMALPPADGSAHGGWRLLFEPIGVYPCLRGTARCRPLLVDSRSPRRMGAHYHRHSAIRHRSRKQTDPHTTVRRSPKGGWEKRRPQSDDNTSDALAKPRSGLDIP